MYTTYSVNQSETQHKIVSSDHWKEWKYEDLSIQKWYYAKYLEKKFDQIRESLGIKKKDWKIHEIKPKDIKFSEPIDNDSKDYGKKRYRVFYMRMDNVMGWDKYSDKKKGYWVRNADQLVSNYPDKGLYTDPIASKPFPRSLYDTPVQGWWDEDADSRFSQRVFTIGIADTLPNENGNYNVDWIQLIYNEAKDTNGHDEDYTFFAIRPLIENISKGLPQVFGLPISIRKIYDYTRGTSHAHWDAPYMISAWDKDDGNDDEAGNILYKVRELMSSDVVKDGNNYFKTHNYYFYAREGNGAMKGASYNTIKYILDKLNEEKFRKSHRIEAKVPEPDPNTITDKNNHKTGTDHSFFNRKFRYNSDKGYYWIDKKAKQLPEGALYIQVEYLYKGRRHIRLVVLNYTGAANGVKQYKKGNFKKGDNFSWFTGTYNIKEQQVQLKRKKDKMKNITILAIRFRSKVFFDKHSEFQ